MTKPSRTELIDRLMLCFVHFRKGLIKPESDPESALPRAQAEALLTIGFAGQLTAGQLAEQLSITPGAATQLTEALHDRCLITRTADSQDRRQTDVQLSEEGKTCLKHVKEVKQQMLSAILEDLSDQELRQLTELMEKVANSVHQHQQRSTH